MSNTKQEQWRTNAEELANRLEWQAAVSRLMAQAASPDDAVAVATDLARAELHSAQRRRARGHGLREVPTPAPVSTLLTDFAEVLRTKAVAVAALLTADDRLRLSHLAPALARAIDDRAPDVVHVIGQLITMEPDVVALWLRMNLEIIERRLAS